MQPTEWMRSSSIPELTAIPIALRDALAATALPFIEVHISNVYAREKYRQHSYLSDIANGVIVGLGTYGYQAALQALLDGKGL